VDCDITENDGAIIRGVSSVDGNTSNWAVQHDHRLAMTGYIAKLVTDCEFEIEDMAAASISWPSFVEDIESLVS